MQQNTQLAISELSLAKHSSMLLGQAHCAPVGCQEPPNQRSKSAGLLKRKRANKIKRVRKQMVGMADLKNHVESKYLLKRAMFAECPAIECISPLWSPLDKSKSKRIQKTQMEFIALKNSSKKATFPCFTDCTVIRNPELMLGCSKPQDIDNDQGSTDSEISRAIRRNLESLVAKLPRFQLRKPQKSLTRSED